MRQSAAACFTLEVHGATVGGLLGRPRREALPFDAQKTGACPDVENNGVAIHQVDAQEACAARGEPRRREGRGRGRDEILAPGASLGAVDGLQSTMAEESDFGAVKEACYDWTERRSRRISPWRSSARSPAARQPS